MNLKLSYGLEVDIIYSSPVMNVVKNGMSICYLLNFRVFITKYS